MRNAINLFLILAISFTFSGCSKSRSFKELVLKDGIYYLKESTKPYSGKILERFPSGEDSLKARITNGVLDGDYTTYYKSGAVRDSMIYKTDTLIRKKSWNENGNRLLIPRSSLIIDKDWRCFLKTPDGKQIPFSGLTVDSNYVEYDVKWVRIVEYLNGDKDGILEKYNLNGKIDLKISYKNGKQNGQEISFFYDGSNYYSKWWKNGLLNGESIYYYGKGKIKSKEQWINGYKEGKTKNYFESGKVQFEANYSKDEMIGKGVWYNENGNKICEGQLLNNVREGLWIWFNENGSISSKAEYKDGNIKMKCKCCGQSYWSNEGWTSIIDLYNGWAATPIPRTSGEYCSERCASRCQ